MKIGNILPKIKWPSKKQWAQIFSVLGKKERILLLFFLILFLGSAISLVSIFYCKNTKIGPAVGGSYKEGMVGSPRFINPIYAAANDADSLLIELIFSGLMEYNNEGELIPELALQLEIEGDGISYLATLREDVTWHDGKPLTADDVIFTIETIQNPDYKSPLRANYLGVMAEKVSDYQVRFSLQESYAGFLERLTFKILPKHIWENISPQNFLLSNYNLRPIGSGPYQFKSLEQSPSGAIAKINLARFKQYYSDKKTKEPYISEISLLFFETEDDLVKSAKSKNIDGFVLPLLQYQEITKRNHYKEISLLLPRYFAVFFNQDNSSILKNEVVRKALSYATNKEEIISEILFGKAEKVDSPVLPEIYGFTPPSDYYDYDTKKTEDLLISAGFEKKEGQWVKAGQSSTLFTSRLQEGSQSAEVKALQVCLAKDPSIYPSGKTTGYFGSQTKTAVIAFQEKYADDILKPAGLTKGTGVVSNNTRAKLNEICGQPTEDTVLVFHLSTAEDPTLIQVAEKIKEQWAKIGIGLEIKTFSDSQLKQDIIKNRNYELLLFGEVLTAAIDPFPYWHSSQTKDPGLNLSLYENSAVDNLLEKARISTDKEFRSEKYELFQSIVIEQAPAIFLYNPEYIYMTSKDVFGLKERTIFDPAQRFSNIEEWYIKTKRVWGND